MKITFVYPSFERHADSNPQLREFVPCNEYFGPPSLGIASVAAQTPKNHEVAFIDDRLTRFDANCESDVFALSFFTPAATRAFEIADSLRARGKTVVAGGIFPTMMPEVAAKHFDAVVVGEGETLWPQILSDIEQGALKPMYHAAPVDLSTIAPPRVDLYLATENDHYRPDDYPLQLSRGCPLTCDACVLPAVMGKTPRFHSDENLQHTIDKLSAAGKMMSLTEDTSVFGIQGLRRHLVQQLDRWSRMQDQEFPPSFSYLGISMPMIGHLDGKILDGLRAVGMDRFYLVGGFDPITRGAFGQGNPIMWKKAVEAIARCFDHGIDPYVSFLAGNRNDDDGVFDRMLEFTAKTGIELAEFCVSTPYPGTPLWKAYMEEDRIFDFNWTHYNDANVVFKPHNMTSERLHEGYLYLWQEFYRGRHTEIQQREHKRKTVQF